MLKYWILWENGDNPYQTHKRCRLRKFKPGPINDFSPTGPAAPGTAKVRQPSTLKSNMPSNVHRRSRPLIFYVLLLLPFIGLLWPAFYASDTPEFAGIPFFYWYQFLWVPLSVFFTFLAYRLDKRRDR
jgi:hypothetical protein